VALIAGVSCELGDQGAAQRIDREQCLTGVVIDVHQAVELTLGHPRLGSAEPQGSRLTGRLCDRGRQQWAIAALERADGDDAAVAELQSFEWSPDHAVVPRPLI